MKIGISIFAKENDSVWASGITQNILFLAMALKEIHQVEDVFLINGGSGNSLPLGWPDNFKFNSLMVFVYLSCCLIASTV